MAETNNPNSDAQYNSEMAELAESQLAGAIQETKGDGSFFDKTYNALKLKKKALKKPVVKRQIIRVLNDAWESAEMLKDECDSQMFDIMNNLEDGIDVNKVIRVGRSRKDAEEAQGYVEAFYLKLFGKAISKSSIENEE